MKTNWKIKFEYYVITYLGIKFRNWLISREWLWLKQRDGIWWVFKHRLFDILEVSQRETPKYIISCILDKNVTIETKNKLIIYQIREKPKKRLDYIFNYFGRH